MLFPNAVFVLAALVVLAALAVLFVLLLNGFVTFALALALLNGVVA
jgi:hypothetical protein